MSLMADDYFIQGSIHHPGRTRAYLARLYGKEAFNGDNTIKEEYLDMAIEHAKREGNTNLEKALVEARTLKKISSHA
jgi:hypothetical protein